MELEIYYKKKESDSSIENKTITMTYPAFIKHIAIAGQGKGDTLRKFRRWLGMLLYYYDYLEHQNFNKGHFSHPKDTYYNPTEQNHFSNLAGIAIADFLAKKIDGAVYTDVYEAAMKKEGLSLKGQRPDLIAYIPNQSKQFAIEAKGYTKKNVSDNEMKEIKDQAKAGPVRVHFSIACASYNLYNKVTCKYYDPSGDDNATFDEETFKALTKQYYKTFYDFKEWFKEWLNESTYQDKSFYEVPLFRLFQNSHYNNLLPQISLILPKDIDKYKNEGLPLDIEPFEYNNNDNIYIDTDMIGIKIG